MGFLDEASIVTALVARHLQEAREAQTVHSTTIPSRLRGSLGS